MLCLWGKYSIVTLLRTHTYRPTHTYYAYIHYSDNKITLRIEVSVVIKTSGH